MDLGDPIAELTRKPKVVVVGDLLSEIGLGSPISRVVVGFIVGSGISYAMQSRFSFDGEGARPFSFFPNKELGARGTFFPWYAPGILLALLFGVFF